MKVEQVVQLAPVVPVIVIQDLKTAVPLARALVAGGLRALEVTLRTPAALAAIEAIAKEVPEAVVGAGTIATPADIRSAEQAGARFIVSPGVTEALLASPPTVAWLPGVATASEVMRVREFGLTHAKFFPAEAAGGRPMLKSFHGPFPEMRFCPTGGITPANAKEYLQLPNVVCVGGSWVLPESAIVAGDWARIEALAKEACGLRG